MIKSNLMFECLGTTIKTAGKMPVTILYNVKVHPFIRGILTVSE
jgi:hypothetical protein